MTRGNPITKFGKLRMFQPVYGGKVFESKNEKEENVTKMNKTICRHWRTVINAHRQFKHCTLQTSNIVK